MPSALTTVRRRTDRRPPIDWPGRPSTVAGLLEALEAVAGDAEEIADAYRALAEAARPPARKVLQAGKRAPRRGDVALPVRRGGMAPPRDESHVATAATLAASLAGYAEAIPQVIEALRALQGAAGSPVPARAAPLYVPDHLRRIVIDAGTGAPAPADHVVTWRADSPNPDEGMTVPWWPAPAPPALALGMPLETCPPSLTDWQDPAIVPYARTLAALDQARADYGAAASALASSGRPRSQREALSAQSRRYRAWRTQFAVVADEVAGQWAARVQTLRGALAALLDSKGTAAAMPALTTSSEAIAAVAEQIRERITSGQGGRIASDQSEVAFGWSAGLPATLLSYVSTSQSSTRHIDVLRAADSGDPIGSVLEGGAKPDAVDFTDDDLDLVKYAGIGTLTTESANWVANVESAVASVMISRLLRGIEADTVVACLADNGLTATGATMAAAALDGIAQIAGAGGAAGVLALNATDWVTLMSESGAAGGYVNVRDVAAGPAGQPWMGLATVICPTLVAGTALVIDPRSVVIVEAAGAPLFLVDLVSQIRNNRIQVAAETWACGYVANPGGVCEVTVTTTP